MNPFSSINTWLTDTLGPLGPLLAVGLLGMLLILIALPTVMKKQRDRFRELKDAQPNQLEPDKKRALRRTEKVDKLEKFAKFLEPQKKEDMSAAKLRMLRAGYTAKNSVRMYHAMQFVLAIAFLLVGMLLAVIRSINGDLTTNSILMLTLLPCAIGYYLPKYWVDRRLQQRQQEIIEGFPDALDLMLVCVEAGQSLDQSIIRVGKESADPVLDLRDLDCGCAARLLRRHARQTHHAGRGEGQHAADQADAGNYDVYSSALACHLDRAFCLRHRANADQPATRWLKAAGFKRQSRGSVRPFPVLLLLVPLVLAGCTPSVSRNTPYGIDRRGEAVDGLTVGHRLMEAQEYELALKAYYRAAGEDGVTVDTLSAIGSANLALGRLGQAEKMLRRALEVDPTFVPAMNNLGVVLMEQGNYGEARAVFQRAFAQDSGQTDSIRENLKLAIAESEANVYDESQEEQEGGFRLVRQEKGKYVLLTEL